MTPEQIAEYKSAIVNPDDRMGSAREALLEAYEAGVPEIVEAVDAEENLPPIAKSFGRLVTKLVASKFKNPEDADSGLVTWKDQQHRIHDILRAWQKELADLGAPCSNADLVVGLFNAIGHEKNLADIDFFVKLYVRAVNWR